MLYEDGRRRTAARALMTRLAQFSHMLPTELEIADDSVQLFDEVKDRKVGGFGEVMSAQLFLDTRWIKVAIKTVKGNWTDRELTVSDSSTTNVRCAHDFHSKYTERSSQIGH